jgi:peptidoglycan/LPS O-acetylase OafA/YrhL
LSTGINRPLRKPVGRIPELDGIRGIAILGVLVSHFGSPATPVAWLRAALGFGWAGVDLFFVLSGFLISGILIDSAGSPEYFRRFYLRRVFRIFPIYYAYLILYFFVVPLIASAMGHVAFGGIGPSGSIWYWTYLSNWRVDPHHYLRHFWSLSIEEQFYLVWPLIVSISSRRLLKSICVALVFLSPVLRFLGAHYGISTVYLYQTTPFRLEGLALGGLLAIAWREPPLWLKGKALAGFVWPLALCALAYIVWRAGTSPLAGMMAVYGYTSVALLCAALVYRAVDVSGTQERLARWMRARWLVNFGKYSYGLYVWHFPVSATFVRPVAAAARQYLPGPLDWIVLPAALMIGIPISYGIALVSWNLIERRTAGWKERMTGGALVARSASV